MPVIATMNRIDHLRDKLQQIEQRLLTAYVDDLPAGTFVEYSQKGTIVVEIIRPNGPHRCWVRNPQTGREYLLDYTRVERVVAPEHAQQRPDNRPIAVGLYRDQTYTLTPSIFALCHGCATRCLAAQLVEFVTAAPEGARCSAEHDEPLPFDDSPEQLSIGTYDQYGMHPELQFEQLDDETPQPRGLRPGKLKDRRHRAYRDRRY